MAKTRGVVSVVVLGLLMATPWATSGQVFRDASLGYSIEGPAGWTLTRPDAASIRFEGPAGAALKIQNVLSAARGGAYGDLDDLVAGLKCQLATGADMICLYAGGAFHVDDADGALLDGRQFVADYTFGEASVREWYGIVERAPGDVFYILTYTAPMDSYAAHEPSAVAAVGTWTVAGASGALPPGGSETTGTTPAVAGDIYVVLQDRGHIGPYDYAKSAYDKRLYEFTVSAAGYVALCVVDQAGEAITGWIFAADGTEITRKPGNVADVYTSAYPVAPGTYTVKVGQDHMATESDFEMVVYFGLSPFTIDDLAARFGPRVRVLP